MPWTWDGSKGGTAGHVPSLPKAVQERKGATRWVTTHLPRGWQLQTHGCCFSLALLQDLTPQPNAPRAHSPHPEHGSPPCAHPQQHLLGTAGLMP